MENNMSEIEISEAVYHCLNSRKVPVLSELNQITPNSNYGLLAELEYEFSKHPQGFSMFYEPNPNNPAYKKGESWAERLHLSVGSIKLDFDQIGVRYDSYKEFEAATDKFNGRYYCSFYSSEKGCAFYLRNHDVVDKAVRSVLGDVTVGELYEDSFKRVELRRKQVLQDIKEGKFGKPVSVTEVYMALCFPKNENEFQEETV